MKKLIIVTGLVLLMSLGATYAVAQPYSHEGRSRMGGRGPGGQQTFSLTPDQKAKFQELRSKFIYDTAQLRGDIMARRTELRTLWSDPKSDPTAILNKETELTKLQDQLKDKATQMRLDARAILTPEQLANIRDRWGTRSRRGRGCMMGRGHGMWGAGNGMRSGAMMGQGGPTSCSEMCNQMMGQHGMMMGHGPMTGSGPMMGPGPGPGRMGGRW